MAYMRILKVFSTESPFRPLYAHAEKVTETVHKLRDLIDAYVGGDAERVSELSNVISDMEFEADKIKQTTRERLPSNVMLPVERQDFLEFLKPQDSIADCAQDVARIATFRPPERLPQDVEDGLRKMVEVIIETVDKYLQVVESFSQILEGSFRKRDVKMVLAMIPVVEKLEHEVDMIQLGLTQRAYELESDVGALGVTHLLQIIRMLGEVADSAARAGDRLRIMISRK